jgi:hypothetical protein
MGKIDTWGAVSNRSTVDALGWTHGDRLHIALLGGSVVAHHDETGAFAMGTKPYFVVPAAVRHRSGLHSRDLVLMAADPEPRRVGRPPPRGAGHDDHHLPRHPDHDAKSAADRSGGGPR